MVYQKVPEQFRLMGLLEGHRVGRGGGINRWSGGAVAGEEVFSPVS